MNKTRSSSVTRREFLAGASALGTASLLGFPRVCAAEPPPEITTVRIEKFPASCLAPQFVAQALLRAEGFTDVQFVEVPYSEAELWIGT